MSTVAHTLTRQTLVEPQPKKRPKASCIRFQAEQPNETWQSDFTHYRLRRRLPPMLDGVPRRVRVVYSLLFSLPGTLVLSYGEEIGMGENLEIPGRLAVRSTSTSPTSARTTVPCSRS